MRLQILHLPSTPADPAPFALVIDQSTLIPNGTYITDFPLSAEQLGARAVLVFADEVEIPTIDMTDGS